MVGLEVSNDCHHCPMICIRAVYYVCMSIIMWLVVVVVVVIVVVGVVGVTVVVGFVLLVHSAVYSS